MFKFLTFFRTLRRDHLHEDFPYTLGADAMPTISFGMSDNIFRPSFKVMTFKRKPDNRSVSRWSKKGAIKSVAAR
ncbi:hypothetical protein [Chitinophaga arvensicola]|uniref:Uncharacterized protein n=1 Tax=Chitinophaga arvensicola TaxID=29529 RepID=A0A1I0SE57_9BACT|nr:hypothetical protein [Chitinophaga arvensicola]SEW57484.1 hypothetical protein SAMN04488122_6807 [Chitinophaga arvensicola]